MWHRICLLTRAKSGFSSGQERLAGLQKLIPFHSVFFILDRGLEKCIQDRRLEGWTCNWLLHSCEMAAPVMSDAR